MGVGVDKARAHHVTRRIDRFFRPSGRKLSHFCNDSFANAYIARYSIIATPIENRPVNDLGFKFHCLILTTTRCKQRKKRAYLATCPY
jgi:hypothetical protein